MMFFWQLKEKGLEILIEEILIDNTLPYNNYGKMAQAIKTACAVFNLIPDTIISNTLISYKPLCDYYSIMCFKQDIDLIKKKEINLLTNIKDSDIIVINETSKEELRAFLHFTKQFLRQPYVVVHKCLKNINLPEWILVFEKSVIKKYDKNVFFDDIVKVENKTIFNGELK